MSFWKLYLISLPLFAAFDFIWLGVVARKYYQNQIGFLLRSEPNWGAAILFYVVFLFGMTVFVIQPAIEKQSLLHALRYGALFGFVTYSTYDLTNLALTKNWPLSVTLVDLIWGAVIAATVSVCTYWITQKLM